MVGPWPLGANILVWEKDSNSRWTKKTVTPHDKCSKRIKTWRLSLVKRRVEMGMRVSVPMEGAFKCGKRRERAGLRAKERSHVMSGGGKCGGMFKGLKQDTSKTRRDCQRIRLDAGVGQRSEVMPRFGGKGAEWVEKQGLAVEEKPWVWLSSEGVLLWTPKRERQAIFVLCTYNQCLCPFLPGLY